MINFTGLAASRPGVALAFDITAQRNGRRGRIVSPVGRWCRRGAGDRHRDGGAHQVDRDRHHPAEHGGRHGDTGAERRGHHRDEDGLAYADPAGHADDDEAGHPRDAGHEDQFDDQCGVEVDAECDHGEDVHAGEQHPHGQVAGDQEREPARRRAGAARGVVTRCARRSSAERDAGAIRQRAPRTSDHRECQRRAAGRPVGAISPADRADGRRAEERGDHRHRRRGVREHRGCGPRCASSAWPTIGQIPPGTYLPSWPTKNHDIPRATERRAPACRRIQQPVHADQRHGERGRRRHRLTSQPRSADDSASAISYGPERCVGRRTRCRRHRWRSRSG